MSKIKKERNIIKLVRKSNELVEARYKFDIWESRVFTKMLTMIRKDDNDFKSYRIYLKDVVREFQLESNNDAYERLRAGGMKLMSKIVKVVRNTDEGLMELNTPIVVGVENLIDAKGNVEDAKFIDVSFHPGMKPFLLSLKSHFTTYDVRNILKLPSSYSIRIYELLKQYQKIGKRKFEVEELKAIIGVIEEIDHNGKKRTKDNYPLYGNFKQRVLLKAQRDLKAFTDISFTFEQIKKGRKVHQLTFYIFPNEPVQVDATDVEEQDTRLTLKMNRKSALLEEIHEYVKEWVSVSVVRSWVSRYPAEQIRKGVSYTLNQLKSGKDIDNIGGYLQRMVQQKDLVDPIELKQQKVQSKKAKAQKKEELKARMEEALKMLQLEYLKEEDKIINQVLLQNEDHAEELINKVKKTRFSSFDESLSIEDNMKNPMFKAAYRNAIKKRYPKSFEELKAAYDDKIKAMNDKIVLM